MDECSGDPPHESQDMQTTRTQCQLKQLKAKLRQRMYYVYTIQHFIENGTKNTAQ